MKGKKLIACIISALLMMGLITPVYGMEPDTAAETAVGAANVAGLVGGAKTPEELRDESLAAIAETENIQIEENQEIIGAETDAVPESGAICAGCVCCPHPAITPAASIAARTRLFFRIVTPPLFYRKSEPFELNCSEVRSSKVSPFTAGTVSATIQTEKLHPGSHLLNYPTVIRTMRQEVRRK